MNRELSNFFTRKQRGALVIEHVLLTEIIRYVTVRFEIQNPAGKMHLLILSVDSKKTSLSIDSPGRLWSS